MVTINWYNINTNCTQNPNKQNQKQNKNLSSKIKLRDVEWLSIYEYILLLSRTQVWFIALNSVDPHAPLIPVLSSVDICSHLHILTYRYSHVQYLCVMMMMMTMVIKINPRKGKGKHKITKINHGLLVYACTPHILFLCTSQLLIEVAVFMTWIIEHGCLF